MVAIETHNLGHEYGDIVALHQLDLHVEQGECYAFLGLNGAGKTTAVRILTGALRPTRGEAHVFGLAPTSDALPARMGVVFGDNIAPEPKWSCVRYLRHWGAMHGLPRARLDARIHALVDELNIASHAERPIGKLSGGNRRKVEIARALLHEPEIIFLDEPTRELDIPSRHDLWTALRRRRDDGLTIFLSSHDVQEVEALSDRIGIIKEGRLAWEGKPTELYANGLPLIASLSVLLQTGEVPTLKGAPRPRGAE